MSTQCSTVMLTVQADLGLACRLRACHAPRAAPSPALSPKAGDDVTPGSWAALATTVALFAIKVGAGH